MSLNHLFLSTERPEAVVIHADVHVAGDSILEQHDEEPNETVGIGMISSMPCASHN